MPFTVETPKEMLDKQHSWNLYLLLLECLVHVSYRDAVLRNPRLKKSIQAVS